MGTKYTLYSNSWKFYCSVIKGLTLASFVEIWSWRDLGSTTNLRCVTSQKKNSHKYIVADVCNVRCVVGLAGESDVNAEGDSTILYRLTKIWQTLRHVWLPPHTRIHVLLSNTQLCIVTVRITCLSNVRLQKVILKRCQHSGVPNQKKDPQTLIAFLRYRRLSQWCC